MPQILRNTLFPTLKDRRGVTAAEYAIMAVGIVVVVGSAMAGFGGVLQNAFQSVGGQLTTTQSSMQSIAGSR